MKLIDLTGQRYGRLTVVERGETRNRRTYWTCQCDCGQVLNVGATHLVGGRRTSCGHIDPALAAGRRPWPRNPRYLVGEDGSIVGLSGRVLQAKPNTHGYLTVDVRVDGRFKTKTVHSIVCEAFHGLRPEGLEVAHGNGIKVDCRASNLRWATAVDNAADRGKHGTAWRGERHHRAKLTADQVRAIRAALETGTTRRALALRYGVSRRAIQLIDSGQNWGHVA